MKNIIKNTLIALLLTGASCFPIVDLGNIYQPLSEQTKKTLKRAHQGITFFTYKAKEKYPEAVIYRPTVAGGTVTTILCGTKDDSNYISLVTEAEELETLIPIRKITLRVDGFKMDEKYEGLAETLLGKAVSRLARTIHLSNKKYKGTLLVDEYKEEDPMPMNFRLGSPKDLHALRAYLEPHLSTLNLTVKPILLLEIEQLGNDTLSIDDKAFLKKYFTLINPEDAIVADFLQTMRSNLVADQTRFTGEARAVGQKFGDLAMSKLEKTFGEFKYENIAIIAAGLALAGWGLPKLWNMGTDYFLKHKNPNYNPNYKEDTSKQELIYNKDRIGMFKNIMLGSIGVSAAAVGTGMLYEACFSVNKKKAVKPAPAK